MEETGVPRENQRPVASHWQTLSYNVVLEMKCHTLYMLYVQGWFFFFSYLTDLSYFPLKIVARKLQDMIGTGKKWPFWKRGVDGFNYFSLISVILFSNQNHPVCRFRFLLFNNTNSVGTMSNEGLRIWDTVIFMLYLYLREYM